jgi:hypothetical protein
MDDLLKESGLSKKYAMSHLVSANDIRAVWLGKKVRYLRSCDWIKHGTLARDCIFEVREVQNDFEGKPVLRIYNTSFADTFGRCCGTELLEMI